MGSRTNQVKIYTQKFSRIFFNEKGWKVFITSGIITLIISLVTSGSDMFTDASATRNGAFALICACIWIGIFNSIQSICKERAIIKREYRTGLHISSYILSRLIIDMIICFVESLIVILIVFISNASNFPGDGIIFPAFIELTITFFLIIFASDVLGVLISSIVKTETTAMTVMPFVLIIQLVMSGMIFELEGISSAVANLTISKWGLNAICATVNVNDMASMSPISISSSDYDATLGNLSSIWLILLVFVLVYFVISVISLKFVDRDKR